MKPTLNRLLRDQSRSIKVFLKSLPNEKKIINRIISLYFNFHKSFNKKIPRERIPELHLFWITLRGFFISIELMLQGHVSESYSIVSTSVEATGYAFKIYKNPLKSIIWIKKKDYSHKEFKSKFGEPFPREFFKRFPELSQLYDIYNLTRDYGTHSNLEKTIFFKKKDEKNSNEYTFKFSELDNFPLVQSNLNYLIYAHIKILKIFKICFEDMLGKKWKSRLTHVEKTFDKHRFSIPSMLNALGYK